MEKHGKNYLLRCDNKIISQHNTLSELVKSIFDKYAHTNIVEFSIMDNNNIELFYEIDMYTGYTVYYTIQEVKVPELV